MFWQYEVTVRNQKGIRRTLIISTDHQKVQMIVKAYLKRNPDVEISCTASKALYRCEYLAPWSREDKL